ncbi:MAG: phytanoyl-CoA dioxygenase family protein [Pikeienuella sp.]
MIRHHLNNAGIALLPNIYTSNEIAALNRVIDPVFAAQREQKRAYVRAKDMCKLDIARDVLTPRMRDVLFSILPDPVLYHLHFYEIEAEQTASHIFSESDDGWHRDADSTYRDTDPTHLSIFVYFSDVGPMDGPFEFAQGTAEGELDETTLASSMQGPAGMSFIWNRRFYHRAAANRGKRRRRLLKVSVQRNEFESTHIKKPFFADLIRSVPAGDPKWDVLLGRYQKRAAPDLGDAPDVPWFAVAPSRPVAPQGGQ